MNRFRQVALITTTFFSLLATNAQADVFSAYAEKGEQIIRQLKATPVDPAILSKQLTELVPLGYQIMSLFIQKYPECKAQYDEVQKLDSEMRDSNFEWLEKKYHDGEGLIQAPTHCYQGRSLVVHPYMALALLRENKDGIDHEIDEVVKRAPKIKARLGLK